MEKYTVTKGKAEVYRIVLEEKSGWADITVEDHEGGGSLEILSDQGCYRHLWTSIPGDKNFREFLYNLQFSYFMEKACDGDYVFFDARESVNELKKDLLEMRRQGWLSKISARRIFNKVVEYSDYCFDDVDHYYECLEYLEVCEDLRQRGVSGYELPTIYKYSESCLAFWENLWPCFRDVLKREIAFKTLELV